MSTTVINPTENIYPATADYVHAMEVKNPERLLFVSETMGLRQDGKPGETLTEQLALIWSNIETILQHANMSVDNIMRVTSYLRNPEYT